MSKVTPSAGAENIKYELNDLYARVEDLREDLESCSGLARHFSEKYRGEVAQLGIRELAELMDVLGTIQDKAGRAFTYAYLWWSTDTADEERGALLQEVKEKYTAVSTDLLFFELEWADVDEKLAALLLGDESSVRYRHYLEMQRIMRPFMLSEPEEKILVEKEVTGRSAWTRFFDEALGDLRYNLDGNVLTQQEILAKLHSPDRDTRKNASAAFTVVLNEHSRMLTYVFNTILSDKATNDRLRGLPTWISSRNLSNEVDDRTVESLIDAVTDGYPIVSRFYSIKKRVLGLDTMYEYDRYAPVDESDREIPWSEARQTVTESYSAFHPEMGEIVERFFSGKWIDAALAPNKRGGAFSHGAVPSAHPYILMNYTGRVRDVQTLAHELGHGVHQYLSREQGIFQADTPLTTAETASVFGEMLVFQRLLAAEDNPRNRLAMLIGKIDDTIATVFRQVAMNRFEHQIHTARREDGELSVDRISEAWMSTQRDMFLDSVTLTEDYRIWWSYIPHFLHTPGYVYAYAFGELLVLALYQKYRSEGKAFAGQYMDLLRAGGSDWPHILVGRLGIDLTDPSFWLSGVSAIEDLVDEADALSRSIA